MFQQGNGTHDVLYYGTMFSFAKQIKDFNKQFDRNQDLVISCTDCAKNKYGKFIKVKK